MKRITVHGILLVMLLLSLFGTLYHKSDDGWCNVVTVAVVFSSFVPLVVFGVAVFFYA